MPNLGLLPTRALIANEKLRPLCIGPLTDAPRRLHLSPEILVGIVRLTDFCLVFGAGAAAFALYVELVLHATVVWERYLLTSLLGATVFVAGFQYINGYTLRQFSALRWQLTRVTGIWLITVFVLLLAAFVGKMSETYSRGWTLGWVTSALVLMLTSRGILQFALAQWMREGYLARNVVVVGAGEEGKRLIRKLLRSKDKSIAILGVFDDRWSRVPHSVHGCKVLGDTDDLLQLARQVQVDEVIISLPLGATKRLKQVIDKLRRLPVDLRLSAEPVAEEFPVRSVSYVGGVPMIAVVDRPIKHWNAVAKWVEDKALSGLLLLLLSPLMTLVALAIKLNSRGPVLFVQERFGFNNNVIRVLKFRTMYTDRADLSGTHRTVQNDPRVTCVGRVLRALSIDELPQLFNVLIGNMSLVGPRPHPITMKADGRLYGDAVGEYALRHRVKPGITGWAQVNGCRGEIDTLDKARARVELDLFYIDHWSLSLDLKTVALTIPALFSRRNAY